jgi:Domain of unknown function (DUF4157)
MSSGWQRWCKTAACSPRFTPVRGGPRPLFLGSETRTSKLGSKDESAIPRSVCETIRSSSQPLDSGTRSFMEPRFGYDFSAVRVHTEPEAAQSAKRMGALAYTLGSDLVFGPEQHAPETRSGQRLIAHELAHVAQQNAGAAKTATPIPMASVSAAQETEADRAADAVMLGSQVMTITRTGRAGLQRKVEMRDVGRGEQSGFARLPELIVRLNAMSQGLTFSITGKELTYEVRVGGTPNGFDQQMMPFIDQAAVIPLRLTNRHGLLGDRVSGFNDRVEEDAWSSGYVDIDDLLASSDLGLQSVLVHFLRERSATSNYARRIGSASLDTSQPGPAREFNRAHALGIEAEVQLLRDFFADPSIRLVPGAESGEIFRVYTNSRRDRIRTRVQAGRGAQQGIDAVSIDVVTRDGRTHTAEEYRTILAGGAVAAP